jgi:hypothetical protein
VTEILSNEAETRKRRTFQLELRRGVSAGILETAANTFLLLIAVKFFQSGANEKALLVIGSPLGLLLSPLAVALTRWMGWTTAKGAAVAAWMGCAGFAVAASSAHPLGFVIGSMAGVMSLSMGVPLLTQIYHENYPAPQRGDLFSKAVMVRVLTSAIFAWLAGWWLEGNMAQYRLLMAVFAIAAGVGAVWTSRCPSTVLSVSGSANPLHGMRHVRNDRLFRWLLISWMLMGFGNLLMLQLRVEYLASPRFGVAASPATVALVVSTIPSLTNLVFARFWGRLFDRINFFVLRIILNGLFVAAITSFFIVGGMGGFVVGGFLFGMANSGGNLAWSLWVTKIAAPEWVADYMGVHSFLTGVRGIIAPFLAFYLIEVMSMSSLSWWALASIVIGSLILVPEARTLRRKGPGEPLAPRPSGV